MRGISQLEILISIPWGSGPGEIPPALEDYPYFSEVSADQMRKVRTPLHLRLDSRHGVHVLPDIPSLQPIRTSTFIYHFGEPGNFQGSTPVEIEPADYFHIHDYAVHANGDSYLLDRTRRGPSDQVENNLRKIAPDGTLLWSHTGHVSDQEIDFPSLKGNYSQLLIDEGPRLYLPVSEPQCAIAELDAQSGAVLTISNCEKLGARSFIREGKVYSVVYFPSENRRGLARFDVNRGHSEFTRCDADLFGWLIYPVGVDDSGNFYVFQMPTIGQINFGGMLVRKFSLDNLLIQPSTQYIYVSNFSAEQQAQPVFKVEIHKPDARIERQEIRFPFRPEIQDWKLIHVDELDRLFVFGGEAPGRAGTLLIFSKTGNLEKELFPAGDLLSIESRLEPFSYWQVDAEGRLYLPVTDGQGFRVIRLTL